MADLEEEEEEARLHSRPAYIAVPPSAVMSRLPEEVANSLAKITDNIELIFKTLTVIDRRLAMQETKMRRLEKAMLNSERLGDQSALLDSKLP
jgi:hypothetical protein